MTDRHSVVVERRGRSQLITFPCRCAEGARAFAEKRDPVWEGC